MYDAKQSLTRLLKSESNAMVEKLDLKSSGLGTKQSEPPIITAAAERISKMVEDGLSTHRSFAGRSRSLRLAEVESRRRHIWLCDFPSDFSNNEPEADEAFFARVATQIA